MTWRERAEGEASEGGRVADAARHLRDTFANERLDLQARGNTHARARTHTHTQRQASRQAGRQALAHAQACQTPTQGSHTYRLHIPVVLSPHTTPPSCPRQRAVKAQLLLLLRAGDQGQMEPMQSKVTGHRWQAPNRSRRAGKEARRRAGCGTQDVPAWAETGQTHCPALAPAFRAAALAPTRRAGKQASKQARTQGGRPACRLLIRKRVAVCAQHLHVNSGKMHLQVCTQEYTAHSSFCEALHGHKGHSRARALALSGTPKVQIAHAPRRGQTRRHRRRR